ncbi:MAG: hypothetical protein H7Y33_02920 [Cytophagales bacterium]|nr:hypothetical protein [Rhizobacter sp.]
MKPLIPRNQRGAATVAITLMLAFVVLLTVTFANRSVLFEAKTSSNQYRAAQAHEAAEAGLDWALAQLNNSSPIGDDCLASNAAVAVAFRERAITAMQAVCTHIDSGWSCRCAISGEMNFDNAELAFSIRTTATAQLGVLQVSSTGRSRNASTQVHALVGRLPGLDTLPAAALTVRGVVTATFSVHHSDPATGGLTAHSGGAIDTTTLRLVSTPGTPAAASVAANDAALTQLTPQGLFASVFRMDKTTWRAQPVVREMDCESACDTSLNQAATTNSLFWLRGGLRLSTPIVLGTPQRPVLLVVDGPVELHASAVIHGVIYSTHASWADTGGATLHGAVIVEGDLHANGSTHIHHDSTVLRGLHERSGSYARMPGGWRDF